MAKKVAILQSNYIPWKGYFDLIDAVDEFVLFDDMQYTKRDWRNRNKIKTPNGTQWLTIPVAVKGRYFQKINQAKVTESNWPERHWNTICGAYAKAPFFEDYRGIVQLWYEQAASLQYISEINKLFIGNICKLLSIETRITLSSDYQLTHGKSERLAKLCMDVNASVYLSGPAAKSYLDCGVFEGSGISVQWMDYSGYEEYSQLFGRFDHCVSVLDVIFNCGAQSCHLILKNRLSNTVKHTALL